MSAEARDEKRQVGEGKGDKEKDGGHAVTKKGSALGVSLSSTHSSHSLA